MFYLSLTAYSAEKNIMCRYCADKAFPCGRCRRGKVLID